MWTIEEWYNLHLSYCISRACVLSQLPVGDTRSAYIKASVITRVEHLLAQRAVIKSTEPLEQRSGCHFALWHLKLNIETRRDCCRRWREEQSLVVGRE